MNEAKTKTLKDYSKVKEHYTIKTVAITTKQAEIIERKKINLSELVRDLLDGFFNNKKAD